MQFYCIGGCLKTSQYLVWPQFASRSATHLLSIELIQFLIVACWMLVHSSSMAVRSCWLLAGTGTHCCVCRSRAFQTCLMGDMSSEYAGHARTGMFSASMNYVQILATWGRALSCCDMRWYLFKVQGSLLFVTYTIIQSIISSEMQVKQVFVDEWQNNMPQHLIKVSSQVTFIYIALLTIQIVTKHCTISK